MNILIITTYYPPDTAIAAVRPYMLSKYLTARGHRVTVIRSGLINKKMDDFYPKLDDVEVISYMGEDSPAERYERGDWGNLSASPAKESRINRLPKKIRKPVAKIYRFAKGPIIYSEKRKVIMQRYERLKSAIDALAGRKYDIVFSTFSDLENAYGGRYASRVFNCKWVMDFRDPIAQRNIQPYWEYLICKREQEAIIKEADCCTSVSDEMFLEKGRRDPKIITIHNGYEADSGEHAELSADEDISEQPDALTFCYTGQIYRERFAAAEFFIRAVASLVDDNIIDCNKVRIYFAGNNMEAVSELADKYGISEAVVNMGYLSKARIEKLQKKTDVFLVLSWNTKFEKGVLTGKFYEGLRADKPILAVVAGEEADSELYKLYKQYNYGYCSEIASKTGFEGLREYISDIYHEKQQYGEIENRTSDAIIELFRYDNIAEQLEKQFQKLL